MKEINLKVEGMMCTGCENRIQNAVKNMNEIKSVKADHTTGTVKIEAEDGIEESKIKEKIAGIAKFFQRVWTKRILCGKIYPKFHCGVFYEKIECLRKTAVKKEGQKTKWKE